MTTPSHSYGRVLVGVTMDAMMDAEIGWWAWTTSLVRLIVGGRLAMDSVQQRPIRVLSGSHGDIPGRGSVVVMKDLLSSRHSIRSSIATLEHVPFWIGSFDEDGKGKQQSKAPTRTVPDRQ